MDYLQSPSDPNRCQTMVRGAQCSGIKVPGYQFCSKHGTLTIERTELRNLKLTKFKVRLIELGSSSNIMSLRDEIGIMRITLEELINTCEGSADLIMMSGQIAQLVNNIGKLVKDCSTIEEKTGFLLSKEDLSNFASKVIEIICKHIIDPDQRRVIAEEVVSAAESCQSN